MKRRLNNINEIKTLMDTLINLWDFNEKGEKDELSVLNNCISNTIGFYYNFTHNYTNKIMNVCGCISTNNPNDIKLGHYWTKIKIKREWYIIDMTAYYLKMSYTYHEDEGGVFKDGLFHSIDEMKKSLKEGLEEYALNKIYK
jgi:hypothetical protein